VEAALGKVGLTFTQWLVLKATDDLIREEHDAVNQNAVAHRTELDRMTISQVMTTLMKRDLVDRGPDLTGRAYRIWITRSAQKTLRLAKEQVEGADEAWALEERRRARD
jgi:DNA-binding MarR family transcriptional regulator